MCGWSRWVTARASFWKRWRSLSVANCPARIIFEGHPAIQAPLPRLGDDAHAAVAELPEQFVIAEVGHVLLVGDAPSHVHGLELPQGMTCELAEEALPEVASGLLPPLAIADVAQAPCDRSLGWHDSLSPLRIYAGVLLTDLSSSSPSNNSQFRKGRPRETDERWFRGQ
jgi:hypothetical protein